MIDLGGATNFFLNFGKKRFSKAVSNKDIGYSSDMGSLGSAYIYVCTSRRCFSANFNISRRLCGHFFGTKGLKSIDYSKNN